MEDFKTIGCYEVGENIFVIETNGECYKLITIARDVYEYPPCLVFVSAIDLNNWIERMDLGIPKIVVNDIVNKYCCFLDNMFSTLLDAYTMKDWKMSWEDFIEQAKIETIQRMDKWKEEKVLEDD